MTKLHTVVLAILILSGCQGKAGPSETAVVQACSDVPRLANTQLPISEASDEWFQVYETSPNTYAIVEPFHFQEVISHLIVGEDSAVLFDTGMGFSPIRPVVERITHLPVSVLNSHTHYDHVGGNHEFATVLAVDTEYTRANMAGFHHDRLAVDLATDAFCKGVPKGFDPDSFFTRPWSSTRNVSDGEVLKLGGRSLQVLQVPGHTPDAVALLDAENGLLFTGDSFYEATIWLFVPETNLDDYGHSIDRLARLENTVTYSLGAHNVARVEAGALKKVRHAFETIRSDQAKPVQSEEGRLTFDIDGVVFLTADPVLNGQQGDTTKGGSGLDLH